MSNAATPDTAPGPDDPETPSVPHLSAPAGGGATGRRLSWWWKALLGVLAVLALAVVVADHVELDEYALSPGVAQPVSRFIHVPSARAHRIRGAVLLTDVYLTQVTALGFVLDELRSDVQVLPAVTVLGPATPASELTSQAYLEMAQSQVDAKAAALRQLGYKVEERDVGSIVFAVVPGSPAARVLKVGQIVTAVDGTPVANACALSQALAAYRAGQHVQLTVERATVTSKARIEPGPTAEEDVTLARWPSSIRRPTSTPACPGAASSTSGFLGIEGETQQDFSFPFSVSIRTSQIGGPSAGLAMTLGIVDTLTGGDLTAGKKVAATGTIEPDGDVGEVGGVPEKTVAVERAGATVFLVPWAQRSTALSKASPSLHVIGVRTLSQALHDLRRLGETARDDGRPSS